MILKLIRIFATSKLLTMKKILKLVLRFIPKRKLIAVGMEIVQKGIEKGKDKLDAMEINGKDIRREDLDKIEEMIRYYLKK
jgi:hypothetical protein